VPGGVVDEDGPRSRNDFVSMRPAPFFGQFGEAVVPERRPTALEHGIAKGAIRRVQADSEDFEERVSGRL
jgi:hypothetical protein